MVGLLRGPFKGYIRKSSMALKQQHKIIHEMATNDIKVGEILSDRNMALTSQNVK